MCKLAIDTIDKSFLGFIWKIRMFSRNSMVGQDVAHCPWAVFFKYSCQAKNISPINCPVRNRIARRSDSGVSVPIALELRRWSSSVGDKAFALKALFPLSSTFRFFFKSSTLQDNRNALSFEYWVGVAVVFQITFNPTEKEIVLFALFAHYTFAVSWFLNMLSKTECL